VTFPILCDLDGVVWLDRVPIPGSVDAIARLRTAGHRVVFVTNNSVATIAEHVAALGRIGVDAEGDVLSSAAAAATLVNQGDRVLVAGGPGVRDAVRERGATIVESGDTAIDVVVVGLHLDFDYAGMRRAATAIRAGARFIGTNEDATFPTPDGPIPGGGAILAAIATAAGAAPEVAGKPHAAMAALAREHLGGDLSEAVMVGDRLDTDARFATTLGCRFALVYSGVTSPVMPLEPTPDLRAADLAGVADLLGA
jgi:4-nitrophenyl phosphatase